ncbi:leucine--tRNA ligase [Finegoldia magna]|uniref:leucine--tRNA ligase n=1 Tax=Finegoldia magna TaxID=1260 RepID=UPI0001DE492E|nr:leucine--tRNA ligase [Finegoldia magna]EFK93633.1 leucine--tRNA ligase [Finegoldia magna ACS-171-V-Col3]MDU4731805.1 leucine--tRNA ligase [Finegoldia magna]MSB16413.1 leucine--tRNA ligase [Finegoldia magna]MSD45206.1 leucine--tRNA ligase [Finegoldia magna]
MDKYNPNSIEKKWQKYWEENKTFKTSDDKSKKRFYALVEFPYPSGQGLHVGHPRPYTALDIVSRKRRMQGYNVLYPMGWDAFGLPTENFAIKNKIRPEVVTENNIKNFKRQMQSIGFSFDWDREINTTDPDYYKWTQWIFIQMFKKGLAYKKEMPINWCPSCKTGLANEEVINGHCERCGGQVVRKVKNQWMLKITEYADRLIDDLKDVDYFDRIKSQQINWIGRSYGAEINFAVKEVDEKITVFTTRADTIFGATYMVISVDHPLIEKYSDRIKNIDEIRSYRSEVAKKSELERTDLSKEKTGYKIDGLTAINPLTNKEIPVYVSDYVLMTYGTGAIMAVPAHDDRDYEFAKKFNIEMIPVIEGSDIQNCAFTETNEGNLINSGFLNGLTVDEAKEKMYEYIEEKEIGHKKTNYKLRDWVFSRQRYWGEPIPLVYCEHCGWVPLDEKDLPLVLPKVDNYEPTDNGESPLSKIDDFVHTKCPKCGRDAVRETDTMPQWAGSSWYYLRYTDPHNDEAIASKENLDYYTPVDWYNGGMEHTTLHLLYSRFWHKFLYDIGVVPTKEPYMKRTSHGMILGDNNEKMSKSRGNVVNPDDIVRDFGADTLRCYEMFIGDFEKSAPWSENGVKGCRKFLDKVWRTQELVDGDSNFEKMETLIHQTIKKVSEDYENLKFNTAIAQLMTLLNEFNNLDKISKEQYKIFLILLNPVCPHITEEIWQRMGYEGYVHESSWPEYDESKTILDVIELPIQVNGKLRATVEINREASEDEVYEKAVKDDVVAKYLEGKNVVKKIYVKGRIFNIIVK